MITYSLKQHIYKECVRIGGKPCLNNLYGTKNYCKLGTVSKKNVNIKNTDGNK